MAEGTSSTFDKEMDGLIARGRWYRPARDLVHRLSLALPRDQERLEDILRRMALLVRDRVEKTGGSEARSLRRWLKELAKALDTLQVVDRTWISSHVWDMTSNPTRPTAPTYEAAAGTRDIRLDTDPNLECYQEDGGSEDNTDWDLDLLGDSPMEVNPSTVEGSPMVRERMVTPPLLEPSSQPAWSPIKMPAQSQEGSERTYSSPGNPAPTEVPILCQEGSERTYSSRGQPSPAKATIHGQEESERTFSSRGSIPSTGGNRRTYSSRRKSSVFKRTTEAKDLERTYSSRSQTERTYSSREDRRESTSLGKRASQSGRSATGGYARSWKRGRASSPPSGQDMPSGIPDRSVTMAGPGGVLPVSGAGPRRRKQCWIPGCEEANQYPKVHAFRFHIPEIFDERLPPADREVLVLRKKALQQASTWLLVRPGSWDELLKFIRMQHLLNVTDNTIITELQTEAMTAMCHHLELPVPVTFQLEPITSVAALIHWKAVLLMAALMDPEDREYWKERFPAPPGMLPQRGRPQAFDAHFHLDRTLRAMGLPPQSTLRAIICGTEVDADKEVDLVGTCASFCDPDTYPSVDSLLDLPSDMVVAVGLHPKRHFRNNRESERCFARLRELIGHARVTAVGEVGLDHSEPMRDWHDQVLNLKKILPLVLDRHVLVLHCRGMAEDNGTEVYMLLLHLVRQGVPRDQRIYLHCFNGDEYVLHQWISTFPNLYLGFTRLVNSFNGSQVQALRNVDEARIVLETDAPYFTLRGKSWSAPNQLFSVAKSVAALRLVEPEHLLSLATANAIQLFHQQ